MTNDILYRKFIETLTVRNEYICSLNSSVGSYDYGYGYMQSLVYHMLNDIPEIAEYLKREIEQMTKLNALEGIPSQSTVSTDNI